MHAFSRMSSRARMRALKRGKRRGRRQGCLQLCGVFPAWRCMGVWPKGERLRKAVRWLAERREHSLAIVEEAARRFDLSPEEEDFLIRWFVRQKWSAPDARDGMGR